MIQRTIVVLALMGGLFVTPFASSVESCAAMATTQTASCDGCCTGKKCCCTSEDNQPQRPEPISTKGSGHEFGAVIASPLLAIIATLPPNGGDTVSVREDFAAHSPAPFALICIRLI